MSSEKVEIVTRVVSAWNRRDLEAILSLLHPDVEYVNPPGAIEPGVRSGRGEVGVVFRKQWAGLGADARQEIDAAHAVAGDVVTIGRLSQTMPGSSARIENRVAIRWSVDDGCLTRVEILGAGSGFEDAVRSLGLPADG